MRDFLHFVCAFLFMCIFQVERRRVPPFEGVFEAVKFQCVDFVLGMRVEGC